MEELKELKGSPLGLYDSGLETSVSVLADKVLDVTKLCTNAQQVVIKYANVKRGRIAQICNWYEKGKDLGGCVHYFINEITAHQLAKDEVFKRQSAIMGANAYNLAQAIFNEG